MQTAQKSRTQIQRREEAETRIIEAAALLLAEKGYEGFSLADVGDKAGYSRGLPGHHFGKRSDLLKRVAEATIETFYESVSKLPESDPGLPRLNALIRHYMISSKDKIVRALVVILAQSVIDATLKPTVAALNSRALTALQREIEQGIEFGNVRPDIDTKHHAELVYSLLRGQLGFSAFDPNFDSETLGETFIEMLAHSIGRSAH